MSYWTADKNLVKIGEEQISIPADQGLSHQVAATARKVSFVVPKSSEFIDGKSCYLEFDVKIDTPTPGNLADDGRTRLMMDPAGCGMLLQTIRIYSLDDRTLLEEIVDCNQLIALKSDYDSDDSLKDMKAIKEGGSVYNPRMSSTRGATKSDMADLITNPWFKTQSNLAKDANYDHATQANSVKACVPLDFTGIFSGSIFPNMMVGLYIEIDLTPAPLVVRQLDSVVKDRRRSLNPLISLIRAHPDGGAEGYLDLVAAGANTLIKWVLIKPNCNSQHELQNHPFVVGEKITFVNYETAGAPEVGFTNGFGGAAANFIIGSIDTVVQGGVTHIRLTPTTATLHLSAAANLDGRVGQESAAISIGFRDATSLALSYTIDNLNLVVAEVKLDPRYKQQMLSKARDGSSIEFDIYSATNYKNALLASERQASFQIHTVNSRAKSLLILPTDASVYSNMSLVSSHQTYVVRQEEDQDIRLLSARSGISGCCDGLSSVQFQLDGKMVPSRPIDTRKCATRNGISAFHMFELEKGLDNAGIMPRNFTKYLENFVISRGFATNQGVMDLRNKDLIVNLNYSSPLPPTKNKLFSSFVCHIRRIQIKQGFVSVVQ